MQLTKLKIFYTFYIEFYGSNALRVNVYGPKSVKNSIENFEREVKP